MSAELAANAARALERYRAFEQELALEITIRNTDLAALKARIELVRDFIAALTATPRPSRKPRGNAEAALNSMNSILPEPDMDEAT